MRHINVPTEVRAALDSGATVALSVSGGKDSQAMACAVLAYMAEEGLDNPVVAVHADLGRAEWTQTPGVVRRQAAAWGVPLRVVMRGDGADLLDRIQHRASQVAPGVPWSPGAKARYCTSDLKREPINKLLRRLGSVVISVEGIRAEESPNRRKMPCCEERTKIATNSRHALTWRPILDWSESDVWEAIGGREGPNVHPAYALGNERLSCSTCIYASRQDLINGRRNNPTFFDELVQIENKTGMAFHMSQKFLTQLISED